MVRYSIIVPVYYGSPNLDGLVKDILLVFDGLMAECEIVLVNDTDSRSGLIAGSWTTSYGDRVRIVRNGKHTGQHGALLAGMKEARGEVLITMDDDFEHPPAAIPALIAAIDQGDQLVYGVDSGTTQRELHLMRLLRHRAKLWVCHALLGIEPAPLRAIHRSINTLVQQSTSTRISCLFCLDVPLIRFATRISKVPVPYQASQRRRSSYGWRKLVGHSIVVAWGIAQLYAIRRTTRRSNSRDLGVKGTFGP